MEVITPVHAHAYSSVTEAEYLAIDGASARKYELIDGRLYAMAGAPADHNHISGSIYMALRTRLSGRPCTPFNSDQRVYIRSTASYVYPDVSVACAPFSWLDDKRLTMADPRLVCEVLSDSTRDVDEGPKWKAYQSISALQDMLFVHVTSRVVEHFHRVADDQWLMTRIADQGAVELKTFGFSLPLVEIYDGLDVIRGLTHPEA